MRNAVVLALVGLLLVGCSAGPSGGRSDGSSGGDTGFVSGDGSINLVAPDQRRPAPVVQGAELGKDASVSSAGFPGKVVVINIWGSWCNPCRAEAPDLQAASVETAGVAQFLGLNTKDFSPAAAEAFVREAKITYPSIYDPGGQALVSLAGDLPPNAIPTTLVIDKQGRIAARIGGTTTKTTLVSLINDVAAGR